MAFDIIQYNRDQFKNNIEWLGKSLQNFVDFIYGKDNNNGDVNIDYSEVQAFHCRTGLALGGVQPRPYYTTNAYCYNDFYGDYNNMLMNYLFIAEPADSNNNTTMFWENASIKFTDAVSNYVWDYKPELIEDYSVTYEHGYATSMIRQYTKPTKINTITTVGDSNSFAIDFQLVTHLFEDGGSSINTAQYNTNANDRRVILPWFNKIPAYYIGDKVTAEYIYNNTYHYDEYNTYNNYTFNGGSGNGGGDVYVGAGLGGIAVGVAGIVNFGDIELAIDSILDDLNLNLNPEFQLPTTNFPSYDEIKYSDMGSFYITPIKQIPVLPEAPDVADTFIDVSDYVAVLGGAVTEVTNLFGTVGLDMMLVLTFLSCLVIRHLRR